MSRRSIVLGASLLGLLGAAGCESESGGNDASHGSRDAPDDDGETTGDAAGDAADGAEGGEICGDSIDNDRNGFIDCNDFACRCLEVCAAFRCPPESCGDDLCGGTCGTCADGAMCRQGRCCTVTCADGFCGGDRCGGTCACEASLECSSQFARCCPAGQVGCVDGCCPPGDVCSDDSSGAYACCTPNCEERSCGSDGCGGTCGTCDEGLRCRDSTGRCVSDCDRDCTGRDCGSDGCGGSCGTCDAGMVCRSGHCGDDCGITPEECATGADCCAGFYCAQNRPREDWLCEPVFGGTCASHENYCGNAYPGVPTCCRTDEACIATNSVSPPWFACQTRTP